MKTYFKCSICGEFYEAEKANFTDSDKKQECLLCQKCFFNSQDRLAYEMSDGEFSNYEDWKESQGATICDNYDLPRREC
jgi:hypothetical protein